MDFEQALNEAQKWLDEVDGVEGVAEGLKGQQRCITVFVSWPEAAKKLPKQLHGHPVVVEQTGGFSAQT